MLLLVLFYLILLAKNLAKLPQMNNVNLNLFVSFKLVEKCVAHIHDTNVNQLHSVHHIRGRHANHYVHHDMNKLVLSSYSQCFSKQSSAASLLFLLLPLLLLLLSDR